MKIFIPVKKHSQRVINKNFRLLQGEPLWVRAVKKFSKVGDVFLDTDSEEIYQNSKSFGATAYMRPNHLRGCDVPVNDLISNFIEQHCEDIFETLVQVHVTSPFLTSDTLLKACGQLTDQHDSVVSCDIIQKRFWRPEQRNEKTCFIPVNHNSAYLEPTQNLTPLYVENSAFYVFTPHSFAKTNNRIGCSPLFLPTRTEEAIDIDTEEDWEEVLRCITNSKKGQ